MRKRSLALLAFAALAFVLAYYFYYYEADSLFFTGPAGNLVLVGAIFLTGFLLSLPPGPARARADHGHGHGHEHGSGHGHHEHLHVTERREAEHRGHEHPAMVNLARDPPAGGKP